MIARGVARLLLPLAGAIALAAPLAAAAAGWPTFRGSPALEGASEEQLPEQPEQLWRVYVGEALRATPVAGGGRIYALSERGSLVALSPAGRTLWRIQLADGAGAGDRQDAGFAAPPLYVGGAVVAASLDGAVHAVDAATGAVRWSVRVGGGVQGTPTFAASASGAPDSLLIVAREDGRLRRLDLARGHEIDASAPTNRCDGSAAVAEGTLVYGNCDAALHFFSAATLRPLGRLDLETDGQVSAGVAVSRGVVYAGDRSGRLYAVELASRRTIWVNRDAARGISAAPAARGDLVVFSSDEGAVHGLDAATGRRRWRHDAGARPGAPLLDGGGKVAVASRGSLAVLDARTGAPIWSREVSDEITDPALAEGLLLVGTDDGAVVAFGARRAGAP